MSRSTIILALATVLFAPPPAVLAGGPGNSSGPRPALWKDGDQASIPEPKPHSDALYHDFLRSTFGKAPATAFKTHRPASNINAWDEAPDSSWYTNRNHLRPMSVEEIRRGANRGDGPDVSGPLVVLEGKTSGTSPGFGRMRDARGNTYFIKLDSPEYPELSTGAEVVCSRLFYAMGFNVPEQWIIYFRAGQVRPDPQATLWDQAGRERAMTQADIDEVLQRVAKTRDGRYRAVASLALPGRGKGGFEFFGTRKDDPNDLIPHQHRRELRGLRLLSAWLNHYDIRVGNTMDRYVEENGSKFLRHYLLDFGSTLGSASYFPKVPRMGFSYIVDLRAMAAPMFTLGAYQPPWREFPAAVEYPSVGRFESEMFWPPDWKPVFPLVAFDHMDDSDAYWAAKIVMSFTEEQVRAAFKEGQWSDPRAEETLVQTVLARQRKVGRYAFSRVNPLDYFKITETAGMQELEFQDLAVAYRLADPAQTWYAYSFAPDGQEPARDSLRSARGRRIPLSGLLGSAQRADPGNNLYVLRIGAHRAEPAFEQKWMTVFLEREGHTFRLRGWQH